MLALQSQKLIDKFADFMLSNDNDLWFFSLTISFCNIIIFLAIILIISKFTNHLSIAILISMIISSFINKKILVKVRYDDL